jgi:AraC-like DNA-binding protein
LTPFNIVSANDASELDGRSRVSNRLPDSGRPYRYRLRDRALWRKRFDTAIFHLAVRHAGGIVASYGASRFATEVSLASEQTDLFCFAVRLQGDLTIVQSGTSVAASPARGVVVRPGAGTRFLFGDDSVRANIFLKVADVEDALAHMLDRPLREPLTFMPTLDWSGGLAASLKRQFDIVMNEFGRPDGLADNPTALASMTDLLTSLALRGLRHNYSDGLEMRRTGAIPAYIRRAEDFMRAHCAEPLRMTQIAAAAGCSVRTLNEVFRQFLRTTPLAALHAIRLDQVRGELRMAGRDASVGAIARRYGFTNASRFNAAFRRRFGETASSTAGRA